MYLKSFDDGMYKKNVISDSTLKKKPVYISVFLEIIYIYQFWKNDKGTPFDFIQETRQNWIS